MKPLIGISTSYCSCPKSEEPTTRPYDYLKSEYSQLVVKSGAFPVLLPNITEIDLAEVCNRFLSGLILSGGGDVSPELYGNKDIHPDTRFERKRDDYEISLAHHFEGPILGICRGLQLINVAFGGTLYQNLATQHSNSIDHGEPERITTHTINIERGTLLYDIIKEETIVVNSSHHQGVKDIAEGFVVSAFSEDGLPECIEKQDDRILAVQWHPERDTDRINFKLMRAFVEITKGQYVR